MLFYIFLIIIAIVSFCIVKFFISSKKARQYTSNAIDYADKFNSARNFYHNHFDKDTRLKNHNDIDDVDIDDSITNLQ